MMLSGHIFDAVDIFTFWLLNVSSGFMLSAAHNVLFFVLDWRTPLIHFLHFAALLCFLLVKTIVSPDRRILRQILCSIYKAPIRGLLWPPVALQLVVCFLSAQVHSQNRAGSLYLIRIFDFLGTLFIVHFTPRFLDNNTVDGRHQQRKAICLLLIPMALFGSLSWLEFGHIEFDAWALWLAPLLALATGLHLLLLKRAQAAFFGAFVNHAGGEGCCICVHCDDDCGAASSSNNGDDGFLLEDLLFQRFSLCYVLSITPFLAIPAFFSFLQSQVPFDASWESIDILLMGMSGIFMIGYKYSELWLQTMLEPHHFCALEHTKFFMASIGQWFLQNMAHATVFAALAKAMFIASGLRYWLRLGEMRAKEKCGPKSSLAIGGNGGGSHGHSQRMAMGRSRAEG